MLPKLWGITTTDSTNNGEIKNLDLEVTWISLVTVEIIDGAPAPVFGNSSDIHVYAYSYSGSVYPDATMMYLQIGR